MMIPSLTPTLMSHYSHGMRLTLIRSLTFSLAHPPPSSIHSTTREWSRPSYSVLPLHIDNPSPYACSYWFNWSANLPTTVHTRF